MKQRRFLSVKTILALSFLSLNCESHLPLNEFRVPISLSNVNPTQGPTTNDPKNPLTLTLTGTGLTEVAEIKVGTQKATVVKGSGTVDGTQVKIILPDNPGKIGPTQISIAYSNTPPVILDGFSYYASKVDFTPKTSMGILDKNGTKSSFVAGNLDRDTNKYVDLAVVYSDSNNLDILSGDGQGGFAKNSTLPLGGNQFSIAAADFNKDNLLDLVLASNTGNQITVLQEDMVSFTGATFTVGQKPHFVAISDVNLDQYPDIITANNDTDPNKRISVLINKKKLPTEAIDFNPAVSIPFSDDVPQSLIAQDFNQDGNIDLAVFPSTTSSVYFFKNTGAATFTDKLAHNIGFTPPASTANASALPAVATPLLGTKAFDIAVVDPSGSNRVVKVSKNQSTTNTLAFQQLNLFFDARGAATDPPSSLVSADLDQDGFPDLIVNAGSQISVLLSRAREGQDVNFQTVMTFPMGTPIQSILVSDVNGDNLPDIVALPLAKTSQDVTVFLNSSQ